MKIVWTKTAQKRLSTVLDYIEKEFGETARYSFRARALEFTKLLYEFPKMGTLEIPHKNLRGFQLTKQTKVFYRLKNVILTFFDSRQDPNKTPH